MSDLIATPGDDPVPQIELSTVVLGGPGGPANAQAQALLNRIAKLLLLTAPYNASVPMDGAVYGIRNGTWVIAAGGSPLVNPMTTIGDMIVGGTGGNPTRVAAGTNNYVWTSNGAGTAPSWKSFTGLVASNNLSDVVSASTARTNLELGTAATQASSAFATAAQGTKADSAVQPSALGVLNGINPQTGTTYTFVMTDAGKDVICTNASAIAATVPLNSSVAFPIGTMIILSQGGAGVVTATAASGVTFLSPNGAATTAAGDFRVLEKIATDTWRVC